MLFGKWWAKKAQGFVVPACLVGTELVEGREAGGFRFGAVVDAGRGQLTVLLETDEETSWEAAREWEARLVGIDGLVATCSINVGVFGAAPVLSATFAAVTKRQRSDSSELLTEVARRCEVVYSAAEAAGMTAIPMTREQVLAWGGQWWGLAGVPEWPPRAVAGETMAEMVAVQADPAEAAGDARWVWSVSYEVDLEPEFVDWELAGLFAELDMAGFVRLARVYRPIMDASTQEAAGRGRRAAVLTLFADSPELVEGLAGRLFEELSPQARLWVRRLWYRQQVGLCASAGVGVLGWQHTDGDKEVA